MFALIAFGVPGPAEADTLLFTISDALEAARASDATLAQARLTVAQAAGEAESTWNLLLPDIEIGSSISRSMFAEDNPWSSSLSASASLGLAPGTVDRVRRRTIDAEIAREEWRLRDTVLKRSVHERFYGVLLAAERLAIAERSVELAEQQLSRVQSLFQTGRASELDLLDAEAAALTRRPEVLARRQALASEESQFKSIVGLPPDADVRLVGSIREPIVHVEIPEDPRTMESLVLSQSPRLRSARLSQERLEVSEALANHDNLYPRLSASYSYAPIFSPPFAASEWGASESWRTGSLSFRLTVPLDPLIPGSQGDNAVRAAQYDSARGALGLAESEADVASRTRELLNLLSLSQERLSILEQSLEISRARYAGTVNAFESGGVDLLAVENARQDLEASELALLQARYTIITTIAELDALAGGALLPE